MSDLLRQDEIDAMIDRLQYLKNKLQEALTANKLLQPNQWANLIKTSPGKFNFGDYAKSVVTAQ